MANLTQQLVRTERRGAVLLVTLDRPERLNAWTDALEDRYFDVLEAADADPDIRAIVVTGAGRGFCAGADMDDLAGASSASDADIDRPRPRHLPMTLRTPLVAAVNGAAAGLGLVEALYCDVRFASPDAVFLTAFVRRGLAAEYGVSWLLPRIIGRSRALDLLLSGRRVGGEEAYRIGLVDHLVPADELVDAAVAYAADLATACSPWSIATIKRQVDLDGDRGFEASVEDADTLMRASFRGADIAEGVASFTERRPPVFAPLTTSSTSHKEI
ncbi:enoyl-CoA hydratase/isomerase family protein [Aeromicrobium sp. CFBP 8757]|uniref:enoyl-CoA hydratase-related protein n=1 Tax=Aeromicrobium sp. CFBP 8757 TaxID=2775288 RepID=UPI0017831AF5|nr:enoyl-CoA hydratase-related protein [Aeromicrobium sp. CFBP 8757]MBD8606892.1 enoyl-CoA hydratase/isomerase family protein [Aeromicrobium sp. CFBP 8757]